MKTITICMTAWFTIATVSPAFCQEQWRNAEDVVTVDHHNSNLIRADRQADWAGYRAFRPLPAAYEPSNAKRPLSAEETNRVTNAVDRSLNKAFRGSKESHGPALEIRPVVTDVKRTSAALNVVSLAAVQMLVSYGGAAVRYDLIDAESGFKVGEISSVRKARPWNVYPWNLPMSVPALGQGTIILKGEAKTLRKDLRRLAAQPTERTNQPEAGSN